MYDQTPVYAAENRPRPDQLPHAGMGIASFVLSIPVGILLFLVFVIAGVLETATPGGINEESPVAVIVGLCMLGLLGLDIVAVGLGIAGLFQGYRRRLFAVLGLVFSAAIGLGTLLLIGVGLLVS